MYACSTLRLRPGSCAITTPAAELLSGSHRRSHKGNLRSPTNASISSSLMEGLDRQATTHNLGGFPARKPYNPPAWASHLHPIPSHTYNLGHRHDLSGMQLSGKKVRKLGFLLADAVPQGADSIITVGGIQSNHRRATAVAARYLNLDTYLILRTAKRLVNKDPGLAGNLLVERLVGAHVERRICRNWECGLSFLSYHRPSFHPRL